MIVYFDGDCSDERVSLCFLLASPGSGLLLRNGPDLWAKLLLAGYDGERRGASCWIFASVFARFASGGPEIVT